MASPFETEGTFLTQEQANHINERHVSKKEHVKTSKFKSDFDLVDLLKNSSELTWEQNNEDVWIVNEGWKEGHGRFYLFVFNLNEQMVWIRKAFLPDTSLCITRKKYLARNGK